jgi:hypothetical protein
VNESKYQVSVPGVASVLVVLVVLTSSLCTCCIKCTACLSGLHIKYVSEQCTGLYEPLVY